MSHEYEDEDRDESEWREFEDAPGRMLPAESWSEESDEFTDEEDPEVLAESVSADEESEEFAEEDFSVAPAKGVMYGPQQPTSPGRPGGVKLPQPREGWDGKKGRKLVKPEEVRLPFSPHERLLILDTWQRSGLPAGDFAPLVGLSKHTLYLWKKRFTQHGPAGLSEHPSVDRLRISVPRVMKVTIG